MSEDSAPAGRAPGLLLPPTLIMTMLAIIYARYGDLDVLRRSLAGISCAAVGLVIAVVVRMMTPLLKRTDPLALILMAGVFLAIGCFACRFPAVLLVAIPVSVGATFPAAESSSMNPDNPI